MAQDRISTPQSSTGLVRFYDVSSSKFLLDPKAVMGFAVAVIVFELVLQVIKF